MIIEYCQNAIENAEYRKLDDGTWFSEIPGFEGVWANGDSVEICRKELIEVLEEWLILKKVRIPNPHGNNDISDSLLNEILRQAGIPREDFDAA